MRHDAICINQYDDAEKSEQVKKMHFRYACTSHLIVWVGEASEDSDLGMQTLRQIGEELRDGPLFEVDLANVSLIKDPPEAIEEFDPKPWIALNRLFQRAWFERVIQEICMPDEEMSFVCGRESVPWESVSRASHAVQRYRWGIQRTYVLFDGGYTYNNMDRPVNLVRWFWKNRNAVAESQSALMTNLWGFRSRKCGDPRDKVYAILGICKDLRTKDITVDYTYSVAQVYGEIAKFLIMRDCKLRTLSACQMYGMNVEAPSWAPDWSIDARFRPKRPILNWDHAESLRPAFNASGNSSAHVQISEDICLLTTRGFICATISDPGTHIGNDADFVENPVSQARMFSLFNEWWPLAEKCTLEATVAGERRIDAFWRTLITDMTLRSQKATQGIEGAQFRLWMRKTNRSAFELQDLDIPDGTYQWMEFTASFEQATTNRRFFVTREGYMGLGPRDMDIGDVVCVLLGSLVPFALRAVQDHHILLGECYCHRVMEGEAVRGLDNGEIELQDFVIR
ncbi:hypothetical protein OEA41_001664 [Lepraria neglecta]|uniref:Heterokaryon incompatibility domain-containing protein n=1 Tax=Lepraria neglecta TaxID=209136 RepID=A0AAD9ZDK4_9LECA|nr:hypothetical protein OEA41_001664 [Lepraria neglecta]